MPDMLADEKSIREILLQVCEALCNKGYDPNKPNQWLYTFG